MSSVNEIIDSLFQEENGQEKVRDMLCDVEGDDCILLYEYLNLYNKLIYQTRKFLAFCVYIKNGKYIVFPRKGKDTDHSRSLSDGLILEQIESLSKGIDDSVVEGYSNIISSLEAVKRDCSKIRHVICHYNFHKISSYDAYLAFSHNEIDNRDCVDCKLDEEIYCVLPKEEIVRCKKIIFPIVSALGNLLDYFYRENEDHVRFNLEHARELYLGKEAP